MKRHGLRFSIVAVAVLTAASVAAGDRDVAMKIAKDLRASGRLQNYRLGVKYSGGTAVLSGHVTGTAQRDTAVALVKRMNGVTNVVSKLAVRPGPSASRSDFGASPADAAAIRQVAGFEPAQALPPQQMTNFGMQQGAPMPMASTMGNAPLPAFAPGAPQAVAPARYDQPHLPNHAWPSYAAYPNYAGVTYPRQYSPTAWPYIGPFYPYPQVPLGWRKVVLEWDDGWWWLDFKKRITSP